ncbi:hypothetical protein Dda_3150 [Drechslerella dactyloides]|uniref:Uncharacterized protein n=1 Tax=Drechslerella dactyloides TaxID=74499 RepID=A0AAD6NMK6_DREDA|nr:hypothetical protein Dda_3150 [Drechslerella dactyloides]
MTSRPAFSYPVPHSTFIPLSYESVTTSGRTLKRKRTKSLATNPDGGDNDDADGPDDDSGQLQHDEDEDATHLRGVGPAATPWTPTASRALQVPTLTRTPADETAEYALDFDSIYGEKRKVLGRTLEHRIRNAGYADDITEALPPTQPVSLQAKHIDHVNTILHVCLLRRDWERAKRAFRLLLLSDPERDTKNLRLKRIWKLGVEILSWEVDHSVTEGDASSGSSDFVKRDYTKVFEYINRLIIMYPHYRHYTVGKGVNATTMMPILLHFEVLTLQERLMAALIKGPDSLGEIAGVVSGIVAATDRLKTLQETPPWIDMADLWRLRGQLHIWAADLSSSLLLDDNGYMRHRISAHRVAQKMKERGIIGWEEFLFGDQETMSDGDELPAWDLMQK